MAESTKHLVQFADTPDGEDAKKVADLEALYDLGDTERRKVEQEWWQNACYLVGKQWEKVADDIRNFSNRRVYIPAQIPKTQLTSNVLYPLVRQAAASGVSNMAQQQAVPSTNDEADVLAAEVATDYIQGRFHEDGEEDLRLHEEMWRLTMGICIRKTYWNPDADGYTYGNTKVEGIGDVTTEILNPLQVHLCPWADGSKQRPWIIESDVRDINEIGDMYGKKVEAEEYADHTKVLDNLLSNIVLSKHDGTAQRKHAAILKRLYHIPNKRYPMGRVWVWANGVLLDETDLPEGEMPFVELVWFPAPGRVYPYSFISPLRELQREINIATSQWVELKNRQMRGDIVIRGTGAPTEEIVKTSYGDDGQKRITLGPDVQEFQFMQYNLNANEAKDQIAAHWDNMQRIAGLHDPSTGESPGKAVTATEIAILKEADTQGLAMFTRMRDRAQSRIERLKLLVARNHYHIPRMVRVVGESNAVRVQYLMGADLRNTEDVRPRPSPLITEAMKAQMIQEAVGKGLFDFSGTPTMIANKIKALQASPIPDIDQEIEAQLEPAGLSIQAIFAAAAQFTALQIQGQLAQAAMINEQMLGSEEDEAAPQTTLQAMAS
jgi:hypothetical protein